MTPTPTLCSLLGLLEKLIEKWRDRASEEEYKLHREWAIDQCADELEPSLPALLSLVDKLEALHADFSAEARDADAKVGRAAALHNLTEYNLLCSRRDTLEHVCERIATLLGVPDAEESK